MVDVLVYGSLLYTGSEVIRKAYVYIKNGRVVDYGEQPIPEDYTYAALVLGGEGRIIAPGLTAIVPSIAYPFRFKKLDVEERMRLYKMLSREESVVLSLPAVHEAHVNGITTVVVEALDPSIPLALKESVGGSYGLAVPLCKGDVVESSPGIAGIVRVCRQGLEGEGVIAEGGDGFGYYDDARVLAFFGRSALSTANLGDVYTASNNLRKALGLDSSRIERGSTAELIVLDATRSAAFMLDRIDEGRVSSIYDTGARAETVLVGDHVLVDGGEHLYIVEKHFKEARKAALRVISRLEGGH